MQTIVLIVLLLATVVLSSMLSRATASLVPLPILQIALGSMLGLVHRFDVALEPDVFFLLFLAPLLFLDGWRTPREGLVRDKWTITSLALGLVFLTVLGAGAWIHLIIPAFPWAAAFALAAILSPTDTIAVASVAERVPLPRRLVLILEGESLFNDASGLVCFRFAVAAAAAGQFSLVNASITFTWLAAGGVATGVVTCVSANLAKDWVARRLGEEVGAQILVSLIIPFVAYLLADAIGASGILAAVAAGVAMGIEERSGRASALTRIRRAAVWDAIQFAGHGVIFVLLGQQLPNIVAGATTALAQTGKTSAVWLAIYVFAIGAALTVLRAAWAWVALRFRQPRTERGLVALTAFAGARGAVTLAAAMSIPLSLAPGTAWPARDLAIFLAAGVIVVSLVGASVGLKWVTRRMPSLQPASIDEAAAVRATSAMAALHAVRHWIDARSPDDPHRALYTVAEQRIVERYRQHVEHAATPPADETHNLDRIERQLRLLALRAEREALWHMAHEDDRDEGLIRRLVYDIDSEEALLR